jgi:uncharacterized protein (UPF0335 family)
MDFRKEVNRLADALESGDTYDYGSTSVIYGWNASCDDPTSPAAGLLRAMADEIERLRAEVSTLNKDAQRWRYLERNASIGFTGPPSCNAIVRLKVLNSLDNTLSKIVDRAIAESKMTNESSEIGDTSYPVMYTASHVRSSSPTSGGGFIGKKIYVGK